MTCTTLPKRIVRARTRPVNLRTVRSADRVALAPQRTRRPAWSLLYAILPLVGAVLAAAEFFFREGLARTMAEMLAVGAGIALARLWLDCNWVALAQARGPAEREERGTSERSIREASR